MGSVAAIGEPTRVDGYGLAGALVFAAETPPAVMSAWHNLPADVVTVVLTWEAAQTLGDARFADDAPYSVVLPP